MKRTRQSCYWLPSHRFVNQGAPKLLLAPLAGRLMRDQGNLGRLQPVVQATIRSLTS
jgi:hypothetical protein